MRSFIYARDLSLSHGIADENEVLLVSSIRWIAVRAEGGYREIDTRKALRMLENLDRRRSMDARGFVAEVRIGNFLLSRMDDREVLNLIREAIRDGHVIAVQKGAAESDSPGATVEPRRLVAQVEKATRGKLSFRGRQYKLVVGDDLAKVPGRDSYDVVFQTDARAVLDGIAKESATSAEPLRKASERIGKDWRPPFSQPEGLVLLRRIPVLASVPKDDGPALTPSQMKALLDPQKPDDLVLRLEHLYHDDRPVHEAPFTVELSDGSRITGKLDAKGRATVHVPVVPTRVQFGPDSRPWKQIEQKSNPDYQEELDDIDGFIDSHLGTST